MSLWAVLDHVTLRSDINSSHVEDHGWSTAVFDGSVAAELDEISGAEHGSDMVSSVLDFLDLLDSEAKVSALSDGQLVLECDCR